ncbi:hypothetical protein JCM14244_03340 [Venenivibrio stagnispumantis]|uniref:DUF8082 domain-containing protein n=1 Tax=Venenivibrio stagnispumantis TaxID=407998 RepID=A0AA46AEI5_9AQUI|nr:hypothetical protein [Venenivibrio stagnispumantis]MCW4572818.1 hypothetical protein [Venenivibrio stagnispumantis]SMP13609.1 hypothetical protein SAMN06264868_11122 [Venenivibrio stagnispumantis]
MNISDKIKNILTDAYLNLKIDFIAVYYKGKIIEYKGNIGSERFFVNLAIFVERALDINEVIPGFEEEYLFAENKNITIFLYYTSKDLAIIFINFSKSHLPTFKIEAQNISQKILLLKDELVQYEKLEQKPATQPETQKEPEIDETIKKELEKGLVDNHFFTEQTESLEEILEKTSSSQIEPTLEDILSTQTENSFIQEEEKLPSLEDILSVQEEETLAKELDISKEKSEEKIPSLEEILQAEEKNPDIEEILTTEKKEEIYLDDKTIEDIKKAFIKEIGPIGNFIFKKELSSYNNKLTKNQLTKFIDKLAEEISNIERRNKFLENIKYILEE